MKIDNFKLRQADGVLKALKKLSSKLDAPAVYLFANGREQGYILVAARDVKGKILDLDNARCAAFSEARSSDQIVVYTQVGYMCDVEGMKDATYTQRRYFSYRDYQSAAKFVRSFLENSRR